MATISQPSTNLRKLAWYKEHCSHTDWDKFPVAEQERMIEDDLTAATRVSLILGALIAMGMVLAAVTLVGILLTS